MILIFLFAVSSESLLLDCDFVYNDYPEAPDLYSCRAKNIDVREDNMRFLAMEGIHLFNKSNSDVRGAVCERQNMIYLTIGTAAFFTNVEHYAITRSKLVYIKRNNFRHLKRLKTLSLSRNEIQRIPKDAFEDLVHLEILDLSFNRLKTPPVNLYRAMHELRILMLNNNEIEEINHIFIKHNLKIEEVLMQHNKISTIIMPLDEPQPKLRHFDLTNNTCIDKDYSVISIEVLIEFKEEIARNCSNQCEQKMLEIAECSEDFFELEKENESLRLEIKKLRNYLRSKLII